MNTTTLKRPIPATNQDAVQAALDDLQSDRMHRTLSASDIAEAAQEAEARLGFLPLKDRSGAVANYAHAGVATRSYNHGFGAEVTAVTLVRRTTGGWSLIAISRERSTSLDAQLHVTLPGTVTASAALAHLTKDRGVSLAAGAA